MVTASSTAAITCNSATALTKHLLGAFSSLTARLDSTPEREDVLEFVAKMVEVVSSDSWAPCAATAWKSSEASDVSAMRASGNTFYPGGAHGPVDQSRPVR